MKFRAILNSVMMELPIQSSITFFIVIDPIGIALPYAGMTGACAARERRRGLM